MNQTFLLRHIKNAAWYLVAALLFGLSYRLLPLFSANQNFYLLYGYANTGYGFLENDWVAQTSSNAPYFTALVIFTVRYADPTLFYFYHLVLIALYIYNLQRLAFMTISLPNTTYHRAVHLFLLTVVHSYFMMVVTQLFLGTAITRAFHEGVAQFFLMSDVLQPSAFGVFLLVSIVQFIERRYLISVVALAVASYNSSYIVIGAVLTVTYMLLLFWEDKHLIRPLLYGGFMSLLMLPHLYYVSTSLQPESTETLRQANEIFVFYRGRHHALTSEWLNFLDLIRLLIVCCGLYLTRKTKLFFILLVGLLFVVITAAWQYWKPSLLLGQIFPWRYSAVLVPVSTSILLAYLMEISRDRIPKSLKRVPAWVYSIVALEALVMFIWIAGIPYGKISADYDPPSLKDMMDYIRDHKTAQDVYLIPVDFDNLRLYTGAPIFVDTKSHPYDDNDIIEWNQRHTQAVDFYESRDCNELDKILAEYRITHVLIKGTLDCHGLIEVYSNETYRLYQIDVDNT